MTEEEVETLLAGHEDANGCINYEGMTTVWLFSHDSLTKVKHLNVCEGKNHSHLHPFTT